MWNSTIKQKKGICPECNDGKDKPLIGGKCQPHYWAGKRKPLPKATKPICPVSGKRAKELAKYRKLRDDFMSENTMCEICGGVAADLHHKKPRASHLCDDTVFMAVCRPCHDRIHSDDSWARENGYLLSRYG